MGRAALWLLMLIPAMTSPAFALDPVDDFERGFFSVFSPSYAEHVIPISGYSGHAMWANRKIILEPGDPNFPVLVSNTNDSPFPDHALTVAAQANGSATVLWEWGYARDLTVLGMIDRVELVLGQSPPGGQITAILTDAGGEEELPLPTSGGFEVIGFNLSDFSGPDPTQAVRLGFRFDSGEVSYKISEIRFERTGSLDIDFVGNFVATAVPPLPSTPLRFTAYSGDPGQELPLYRTDVVIQDATAAGDPVELNASWEEEGGAAGDRGAMEVRWDESGVFSDTSFLISFDLAAANGLTPQFYPPDPILDDPTSFMLAFQVLMFDGNVQAGTSNTLLLFDVNMHQGAEFPFVSITPHMATASMATGFDVAFDYTATSGVEVYEPLLDMTWISDWQPPSAAAVPEGNTPAPLLAARPSVTRGVTELWAARPFTAEARIAVHDVSGRLLRSLIPSPGLEFVHWDGRNEAGQPLSSGVYYVRLQDRWGGAVTRVTRVQ